MAELLKYICRAPGCNKKLSTQKRLEVHIKSKHPELFSLLISPDSTDLNFNKNPIENLLNSQMTKPKSTILQPIKNKQVTQSIDNIDNIVERLNMKCNINCLKPEPSFEIQKKNIINSSHETEINEITDGLIFSGENAKYEDYTEIISLDLSKKNINIFQNNKIIPFDYFTRLIKMNLSDNNISNSEDLKYFRNLKILNLNKNKIKDISFCEKLIHLEQLYINSNEVTSIESLYKCNKLKILDVSNNKIDNIINTLKAFKKLKSLEELNINKNPFIINLFAYKHYFIYNYQNLLKIDGEEINEIDKDISGRFIRENISMYENLKELNDNNINDSDEMDINADKDKDSNIIYKIGNTVISKEMHVPYKSKNKSINNNHKDKDNKNIINENNDSNL
jgi:Leucine-rich repeat (LRR) protein